MLSDTIKNYISYFVVLLFFLSCPYKANASGVLARKEKMKKSAAQSYKLQKRNYSRTASPNINNNINQRNKRIMQATSEAIDFDALWEELKITSEAWPLIIDENPKEIIVSRYIALYERTGVIIKRSPLFYVGSIDAMAKNNPAILKNPFKDVLKFVSIMEYDFDNGHNKDKMALMVLGQKLYEENKKRLGK